DQQPQQQRPLLTAPERRERVAEWQRMARVLRDVDERHLTPAERDEEHDRGDDRRRERGEERVLGGQCEPAPAPPGGERAGDERVRDEPEAEKERGAPELSHSGGLGGGVLRRALRHERVRLCDERAVAERPLDHDLPPGAGTLGDAARAEDARAGAALAVVVLQREPHAAVVRVAAHLPDDRSDQQDVARMLKQVARLDLRRSCARDRRVEDEDSERGGNRQRDHEAGWAPLHRRGGTHGSPTDPLLPQCTWLIVRALRRERSLASARRGEVLHPRFERSVTTSLLAHDKGNRDGTRAKYRGRRPRWER